MLFVPVPQLGIQSVGVGGPRSSCADGAREAQLEQPAERPDGVPASPLGRVTSEVKPNLKWRPALPSTVLGSATPDREGEQYDHVDR
jgi:hypothetical protein